MVKFRIDEIRADREGFTTETLIGIPEDLEKKIMHASVDNLLAHLTVSKLPPPETGFALLEAARP
jgi:hypothetical protein